VEGKKQGWREEVVRRLMDGGASRKANKL